MATILSVDDPMPKRVRAAHPDLLFTDILIPQRDGGEFVNPLREVIGANAAGRI